MKMQFFAKKVTTFAKILIILQWILQFCRFQSLIVVFSLFSVFKFEFEKMAAASDIIMLLWLPWKPIRKQIISINWKYKECSLYAPNI